MDSLPGESGSGRSRSFGGCATCRSRHTKCDEARPTCSTCTNAGLTCGGYEKNIFFDFEDPPEAGSLRFRRPLLTEEERKSMSEWLTSTVPSRLVFRNLTQIDEECEGVPAQDDIQISRGPFGAFRLNTSPETSLAECDNILAPAEQTTGAQDLTQGTEGFSFLSDAVFSPTTQQLIDTTPFDQSDQDLEPSYFDMWNVSMNSSRIQEVFDDISLPDMQSSPIVHPPLQNCQFLPMIPDTRIDPRLGSNFGSSSGSLIPVPDTAVPHDAVFLLKHYQTTVLRLLTPFRHSKTPWHVLFIPHAKNCLAALTLGDSMDHASMCAFYGTLAISAFSLGGITNSQMWLDQGKAYKQQAREHVRAMLKTAYDIPKAAKYKSILMALLTTVQISMVTGSRDQTECYFLEAEKFIRLRGLNRRKSRKVRLLHHCYAFERILHESTFIDTTHSTHRSHVRNAIESSGVMIYGQDSGSFRLGKWSNLAQDMMRMKDQDQGENDLHLEQPGVWLGTLYPEIFGVPEPWLFLVSLVIRLGREKDAAEQDGATERLSAKDFLSRATAIEKCINQMNKPSQVPHGSDNHSLDNILEAMKHALAIYFYRRIYDIDASMLQEKVAKVRDCLERCDSADPEQVYGTARLVWPAFIAASEAEDPQVQASFVGWFRNSAQRSGLRLFSDTLDGLENAWQEKRSCDNGVIWLDTLTETVPSAIPV